MPAHVSRLKKARKEPAHQDPSYRVPQPVDKVPNVPPASPPATFSVPDEREAWMKAGVVEFKESLIYVKGVYIKPSSVIEMKFEEGHYVDYRVISLTTEAGKFSIQYSDKKMHEAKEDFKEIVRKVLG